MKMEGKTNQKEQAQELFKESENHDSARGQQVEERGHEKKQEIAFYPEMLEDLTEEERYNFFEEYGKGVMNRYFDRALTEAEENSMKNDLYELNLDLMAKTQEKADIVKSLGDQIKSLQTQMNAVTTDIKKGTKEVYEPCVKVLDIKNNKVYFFAQNDGQFVFVRNITGDDLEQSFPFETVYNVTDEVGIKSELVVSRHGGFPEIGDDTSNEDGSYTMDEESVIVVENGKIVDVDRRSSTKYEPKVGDKFGYEGEHKLPTGYTIFVEDGEITEVYEPGEERPKPEAEEAAPGSEGDSQAADREETAEE